MDYQRRDIEFPALDGTLLRGWFYSATGGSGNEGKHPCIIMTHGFSGLKEQFLPDFAARFASSGFAVLVYDNRNWGSSDGLPRNEIDPFKQSHDYSDAFDFAATLPEVDASRIVFWGSSMSGGNVIVAASLDKRIKAAIVQVPFVSGEITAPNVYPMAPAIYEDRQSIKWGNPGAMVPVVAASVEAEREGIPKGILSGQGVPEFLQEMLNRGARWDTDVTMQSLLNVLSFEPQAYIHRVAPTPLLMVVGDRDTLVPTTLQLKAYASAYEPKKVVVLTNCTHFDPYYGPKFEENIHAQVAFLRETLLQSSRITRC